MAKLHEGADLSRLPKWAREYIDDLIGEREASIRLTRSIVDQQQKSAFYTDDWISDGEAERGPSIVRRYFNAYSLTCEHAGVWLSIRLADDGIEMQWGTGTERLCSAAALIPLSHCSALIAPMKGGRGRTA